MSYERVRDALTGRVTVAVVPHLAPTTKATLHLLAKLPCSSPHGVSPLLPSLDKLWFPAERIDSGCLKCLRARQWAPIAHESHTSARRKR